MFFRIRKMKCYTYLGINPSFVHPLIQQTEIKENAKHFCHILSDINNYNSLKNESYNHNTGTLLKCQFFISVIVTSEHL